jgi:hypothetical protein
MVVEIVETFESTATQVDRFNIIMLCWAKMVSIDVDIENKTYYGFNT